MLNIETPQGSFYFASKEEFEAQQRWTKQQFSEDIFTCPDNYPCYGWKVGTCYNDNAPDEQLWAFVYPK